MTGLENVGAILASFPHAHADYAGEAPEKPVIFSRVHSRLIGESIAIRRSAATKCNVRHNQ
jgi:hypothetical protein